MKVLTYTSCGGPVPEAVKRFAEDRGIKNLNTDPRLAAFVDSFYDNKPESIPLGLNQKAIPEDLDRLWRVTARDVRSGIIKTVYAGRTGASDGPVATVCLNEFDPNATHAAIGVCDGAETLVAIPAYIPVPGARGLYRIKTDSCYNKDVDEEIQSLVQSIIQKHRQIGSIEHACRVEDEDTVLADIIEDIDPACSGVGQELFRIYRESSDKQSVCLMFESITGVTFKEYLARSVIACDETLKQA